MTRSEQRERIQSKQSIARLPMHTKMKRRITQRWGGGGKGGYACFLPLKSMIFFVHGMELKL